MRGKDTYGTSAGFDSLGIVDFFVAVEEECGVDLEDFLCKIKKEVQSAGLWNLRVKNEYFISYNNIAYK